MPSANTYERPRPVRESPPPRRRRRRKRRLNPRPFLLLLLLVLVIGGVLLVRRSLAPAADSIPVPDYVQQDLLSVNPYSRPGDELKSIRGVVIHYVGNPGTSAQANRNYFESLSAGTDGTYASSHFVVGLEGEVIQCVPLTEIA